MLSTEVSVPAGSMASHYRGRQQAVISERLAKPAPRAAARHRTRHWASLGDNMATVGHVTVATILLSLLTLPGCATGRLQADTWLM